MITIKARTECMSNLVPAASVPADKRFVAFLDANASPALLSLDNAGQLNLILDKDGVPAITDFGKKMGLDEQQVVAFDAKQTNNGKLSIFVVTNQGGGSFGLSLVPSVTPDLLESDKLPDDQVVHGDASLPQVYDIYLSDFTTSIGNVRVPMGFLAFQPADRITQESQLGRVSINYEDGSYCLSIDTKWKLATNPSKIIHAAFGTCRVGQGAFVLYETGSGQRKLQFRTFHGNNFQVEPICPAGATSLATYVHPKTGYTVLLVGGDAVTQFTSQQYVSPTSAGTTILSADATPSLKGIHTSVADKHATLWFTSVNDSAYCYTAELDAMDKGSIIPLLKSGHGGKLSGLLQVKSGGGDENSLVKTLLSADHKGRVIMLQQAPETRIWQRRPFYASSRVKNLPIHGYTLRFQPVSDDDDKDKTTIAFCRLKLASASFLRAIVNGKVAALTPEGSWFDTSIDGSLTVFSEARDIPSTLVHAVEFQTRDGISMPIALDGSVDPTENLVAKLGEIKTGDDLLNAKTQTGDYLVPRGSIGSGDAGKAADAIQQLVLDLNEKTAAAAAQTKVGGPMSRVDDRFGILDDVWEAFHYVEERAEDVVEWTVHKISDALQLTITLAGDAYEFIAKTVASVKKAISWVLAKVKVGIEKIIEFAGFLFNWQDILQTSDNLVTLFNAGLDFGQDKINSLRQDSQTWIQDIRGAVQSGRTLDKPGITDSDVKNFPKDPDSDVVHGVPYNWASYQMSHGGGISLAQAPKLGDSNNPFQDLIDLLGRELERLGTFAEGLGSDLTHVISGTYDTQTILAQLSDQAIDLGLGMLQDILDVVFGLLGDMISLIKDIANFEIECPIFTDLWKTITDGRPFTVLNFFSLIIAIPCTILHKLVLGVTPPRLSGRLTGSTYAQYVDGTADAALTKDMNRFFPAVDVAAGLVASEISMIFDVIHFLSPALYHSKFVGVDAGPGTLIDFPDLDIKQVLESPLADILSALANFPIDEPPGGTRIARLALWGIDIFAKMFKHILLRYTPLGEDVADKNTAIVSLVISLLELPVMFYSSWNEYMANAKKSKWAFNHFLYRLLDETVKLGSNGADFMKTAAEGNKELQIFALAVKRGLDFFRGVFKTGYYAYKSHHFPDDEEPNDDQGMVLLSQRGRDTQEKPTEAEAGRQEH